MNIGLPSTKGSKKKLNQLTKPKTKINKILTKSFHGTLRARELNVRIILAMEKNNLMIKLIAKCLLLFVCCTLGGCGAMKEKPGVKKTTRKWSIKEFHRSSSLGYGDF